MFAIRRDSERSTIFVSMRGSWTCATVDAYGAALGREIGGALANGGRVGILIDGSNYPVQTPEVSRRFAEAAAAWPRPDPDARTGVVGVAIVARSMLNKLQAERIFGTIVSLFFDRSAAQAWIGQQLSRGEVAVGADADTGDRRNSSNAHARNGLSDQRFDIRFDESLNALVVRPQGLWDAVDMAAFQAAMLARIEVLRGRGRTWDVLVDGTAFPVQSPALTDAFRALFTAGRAVNTGHTAVVVPSMLAKAQVRRAIGHERLCAFTDRAEAITWLKARRAEMERGG